MDELTLGYDLAGVTRTGSSPSRRLCVQKGRHRTGSTCNSWIPRDAFTARDRKTTGNHILARESFRRARENRTNTAANST